MRKPNQMPMLASVDSIYKCVKQFGRIKPGESFFIETFGGIKGSRVWWCKTLYDNGRKFPVFKTTLQEAVDNGTLKDMGLVKKEKR